MFFKRKKKADKQADTTVDSATGAPAKNEPVIVYTSYDPNEAAMIKSMLTSADIEFHVTNEIVTGYGPTASSAQGMDVLVRAEDADDARTIIGQLT